MAQDTPTIIYTAMCSSWNVGGYCPFPPEQPMFTDGWFMTDLCWLLDDPPGGPQRVGRISLARRPPNEPHVEASDGIKWAYRIAQEDGTYKIVGDMAVWSAWAAARGRWH